MTCVFLRLKTWLTNIFHWCPVKILVESPTCITKADRSRLSKTIGFLPYELDSCGISPCHWPRYWWFNWEVTEKEGVEIYPPSDPQSKNWGKITLTRDFRSKDFLQPGCALAGGTEHRVPTFTAAQPQTQPTRSALLERRQMPVSSLCLSIQARGNAQDTRVENVASRGEGSHDVLARRLHIHTHTIAAPKPSESRTR